MRRLAAVSTVLAVLLAPASAGAAFPGANGSIATKDRANGGLGILTIDPDGSDPFFVTHGSGASDLEPAWSADGRMLAFERFGPGGLSVWVVNADGTGERQLVSNATEPAWSPDGQRLVFATTATHPNGDIATIKLDGTGIQQLTDDAEFDTNPVWSPAGNQIAWERYPACTTSCTDSDIFVMSSDGTNKRNITNQPVVGDSEPDWSPDGQRLVFSSWRSVSRNSFEGLEIYTMRADGTDVHRLTDNTIWDSAPIWSPDGNTILFTRTTSNGPYEMYFMNADGTNQRRVATELSVDASSGRFDWQPLPNRPPDCSRVVPDRKVLWPPNHRFKLVTLSGATDPEMDPVLIRITGVTQDERLGGTRPDALRGAKPNQVYLRAERRGRGDGRVYRVPFTVSDGKGGTCAGSVTVEVPRRKKAAAFDSGLRVDSFG